MGRQREAEPLYQKTLEIQERTLGGEHPDMLRSMMNLAHCLAEMSRLREAEELFRRSLEAKERTLGAEHPSTRKSARSLEKLLRERDHESEASPRTPPQNPDLAPELGDVPAQHTALHQRSRPSEASPAPFPRLGAFARIVRRVASMWCCRACRGRPELSGTAVKRE